MAGIYKFLEPKQKVFEPIVQTELFHNLALDVKTKKIFQICNFPADINEGDEGLLQRKHWVLKGILILIRHGDRGPLQHVRNISAVDCGGGFNEYLNAYKVYNLQLKLKKK